MPQLDPPDDAELLRLVWSPDDFENGVLQPSAFSRSDLMGDPKLAVSVDRSDCLVPAAVRCVACRQRSKAKRKLAELAPGQEPPKNAPVKDEALGAFLITEDLRNMVIDYEKSRYQPLDVEADAVPAGGEACPLENPAHCLIRNARGPKTRGFAHAIRVKLAAMSHDIDFIEEILGRHGEARLQPHDPEQCEGPGSVPR